MTPLGKIVKKDVRVTLKQGELEEKRREERRDEFGRRLQNILVGGMALFQNRSNIRLILM